MHEFLKKNYLWIVFTIMAFFTIVSVLNAWNDSAIFDEVAHIPAGYSYLTQHDTRLNPEHPPLIKDLSAIPLLFLHLTFNVQGQDFWEGTLPNMWDEGQWAAGHYLLYQAGNNPDQIIFWARIPIILLSILFGLFLFKWGKEIAGTSAGLFALTLYAFDPNILGHDHFVTTDLGIAAFLTFSFYYFLKFIKTPTWKNAAIGGFFMGLLLVSKFSSIVVLPIYGLILIVYGLARNNHEGLTKWKDRFANLGWYLLKGIAAFAVATLVIWCVYKVNDYRMPRETFDQTIDFFFSASDPNAKASITNTMLHALNKSSFTRPLASYVFGPAWTFKRVSGGNGAYFLGQVGNGFKNYFPVVFAIKETIPLLVLMLFASVFVLWQTIVSIVASARTKKMAENFGHFLRRSVVYYSMFIFVALYAYVSISGGLNIGFRHLFPILPFIYLLVTKKVFDLLRDQHPHTKTVIMIAVAVLLCWQVTTTALAYPSYTSYYNESIGGSTNGYKYVTDSNTDWGQDLKQLDWYLSGHPEITRIRVDYFGGGNPQQLLGDKYIGWWDSQRPVVPGWYAISENSLQGSIYDTVNKNLFNNYAWTLDLTPTAQIGKSILIYHVITPPVNQ